MPVAVRHRTVHHCTKLNYQAVNAMFVVRRKPPSLPLSQQPVGPLGHSETGLFFIPIPNTATDQTAALPLQCDTVSKKDKQMFKRERERGGGRGKRDVEGLPFPIFFFFFFLVGTTNRPLMDGETNETPDLRILMARVHTS